MSDATVAPVSVVESGPALGADPNADEVRAEPSTLRERGRARLFGQFLIDNNAVQAKDLSLALGLMASLNETIGDRAIGRGWLTRAQADHIGELQRTIDARWGDIAIALDKGGLAAGQIEQLLWEQTEDNLRIGDALVEIGALSCSEAEQWLTRYESTRAVPAGVMADDQSGEYDPLRHAVDGLPRVLLRRAGVHAACSIPRVWRSGNELPQGHHEAATIELGGGWSVTLGLSLSGRLSRALASRARQPLQTEVSSPVACDLLEVLTFYVARRLDRSDILERPPSVVGTPTSGTLPARGLAFAVTTDFGDALLVVDQP